MACISLYVAIVAIICASILKLYFILTYGWCRSQQCLVGKTAIITGANTGIGYETAIDFAKRGAKVILACRNLTKAEAAQNKIISETGNPNIIVKQVNFSSYDSVRKFAKEINETESRLDILVNNAGVAFLQTQFNEESRHLEMMQVNHFAPFLLTNLLGNLLKKSGASRIVNVSSCLAKYARLDVNNLNTNSFTNIMNYCNTKACNVLFTRELARRLQNSNSKVTTYSVHPGGVNSDLYVDNPLHVHICYNSLLRFYYRPVLEGTQTVIYASVMQGIERYNGEYFAECAREELYRSLVDPQLAKKLWKNSAEAVNLQPSECQL